MNRCHLKAALGDSLHAVLCAAGYNIRWLLRMIVKKGVAFLHTLFLRLQKATASSAIAQGLREKLDSLALMMNANLRHQAFGVIG